jgi:hypothetical protein
MNWPLSQDFNEAMQNPASAFRDPGLKTGDVECGPMGLPMPRSGNFADVYRVTARDGKAYAIKCFTRPALGLQMRYFAIAKSLRKQRLPFLVNFDFLEEGIRVKGKQFPVVKMEWVEGFTLNAFVRDNLGKPDRIDALLRLWVRLCHRLRASKIAHGDLQHGNVLLVPGDKARTLGLKLIDYDGLWVPSLKDHESGEFGHASFQHPARLAVRGYSPDVDRFPHLVIACALRASTIAGPALWKEFDNGDNLLFREADFARPAESAVVKALWKLDDPTVTNLLSILMLSTQRPIEQTPWLDDLLQVDAPPVGDHVLALAADLMWVPRRAGREAFAVSFATEADSGNDFAEMIGPRTTTGTRYRRSRRNRLGPLVASVVGLALIAGLGYLIVRQLRDQPNVEVKTPTPPVSKVFEKHWPSLPDAKTIPVPWPRTIADAKGPLKKEMPHAIEGIAAPFGARFLPDGTGLIAATRSGFVVRSFQAGTTDREIGPGNPSLVLASISPDGRVGITVGSDRIVRGWSLTAGNESWSFPAEGEVLSLGWTADGVHVAACIGGRGFIEWQAASGKIRRRHPDRMLSFFRYSEDGSRIVAAHPVKGGELYDMETGDSLPLEHPGSVLAVAVGEKTAILAGDAPKASAFALSDASRMSEVELVAGQSVTAIAFAHDGITLIVGTSRGEVWVLRDRKPVGKALVTLGGSVVQLDLTADGHVLATSDKDCAICRIP